MRQCQKREENFNPKSWLFDLLPRYESQSSQSGRIGLPSKTHNIFFKIVLLSFFHELAVVVLKYELWRLFSE